MTRDERLRWIARHLVSVGIRHSGDLPDGRGVEPREISAALHELVELRAERERAAAARPAEERSLITRMLDRFAR